MAELKTAEPFRLSQACIISAARSEDALSAAKKMAAAALCTGQGQKPCGVCRACRKTAQGIHPDVQYIARPEDDKGRPKREIGVDQIRWLSGDAWVAPNEAERKVYIIQDADTMNIPAQNAALKLLEEPPLEAVFLLCTTNAGRLLPTIRSRCSETNLSGASSAPEEEQDKLALAYIKAVSSGDRARLFSWCSANEGMDSREAAAFSGCVMDRLGDMLCGRRPAQGLSQRELRRLFGLMERCSAYIKANVGIKHIFGLLAVSSISSGENRG